LRIIYELESSFYPRKFNDITVPYGTGVLKTIKSYKYGYFTCRIAFPNVPGQWPAFWLYNGDGDEYSEIDVVEAYSKNGSYNSHIKFQPNIHYKDKGVWINTGAKNSPLPKRANPFYKFSLLWEPDSIKIFYNGYLIKRYTDKTILDKMLDMYVIFNSAIDISSKEIGNKAMTSFSDIEIYQKKK
jgi:beta-glucanase (GH16 family)